MWICISIVSHSLVRKSSSKSTGQCITTSSFLLYLYSFLLRFPSFVYSFLTSVILSLSACLPVFIPVSSRLSLFVRVFCVNFFRCFGKLLFLIPTHLFPCRLPFYLSIYDFTILRNKSPA